MAENILQYESTIWNTADLLRGCGIKESEWPSYMMPFFALSMIESRLLRMLDELMAQEGVTDFSDVDPADLADVIRDRGQGYNAYLIEQGKTLRSISQNDKSFETDFEAYLDAFDGETRWLLGVNAGDGEKFLDIRGVINRLKAKKVLFSYAKEWSQIDLKPFNNSEITTLEEHIKRRWADISAETAGEQYTPDDVIDLISELIIAKVAPTGGVLIIYDGTCGGGNLLFGVEDRIKARTSRVTQTYGQDWNDALYALARIESRFRDDSHIAHGNTLTEDKFSHVQAQVVVANPPYGVSWKGYQEEILHDKTLRFKHLPSVSDGQLLFTQHLIDKLDDSGFGVIVHNGSTLFSGDAGSGESNIRKWMFDADIVEAVIQLPTDEFFNTGIHTYLWVLNKAKDVARRNQVMLIDASAKFKPLKKSKGAKRREVDERSRQEIVAALVAYADSDFTRVFDRSFFYYNKQAILLTNVDADGCSFAAHLKEKQKSLKLHPVKLVTPGGPMSEFVMTDFDTSRFASLRDRYERETSPAIAALDHKEQALVVETKKERYWYDAERETLVKQAGGQQEALGCGKIVVKSAYKAATKSQPARIEITVELTPDYERDYEIIPYHRDAVENQQAVAAFMAKYITRPFEYLDNVVGVEINFNKVFYRPEQLRDVATILAEIEETDAALEGQKAPLRLINGVVTLGLDRSVPMKDSNIEWIGIVPAHWKEMRINDVAVQQKVRNNGLAETNLLSLSYGKLVRKDIESSFGLLPESFETYQIVDPGNIILRLTDLQNDWKSLRVGLAKERGIITSAYLCLRFRKGIYPPFAYYLLHLYDIRKVFYRFGGGLRQSMKWDDIKILPFFLPPVSEQQAIADYLEFRSLQIDQIVGTIDTQIGRLQELRKTLTNDVIAGKLRVF